MGRGLDTLFKSIFFLLMLIPIFLLIYNFMQLNLSPIESVAFLFVGIILIIIFYYFLVILMKVPDQHLRPYRSREVYRLQPEKKPKSLLKKLRLVRKPLHKVAQGYASKPIPKYVPKSIHESAIKHFEQKERIIVKPKVEEKPLIKIKAPIDSRFKKIKAVKEAKKPTKKPTRKSVRKSIIKPIRKKSKKKVSRPKRKVKKRAVRKKIRKKVKKSEKPKKKAVRKAIIKPKIKSKTKKKAHKKAKVKSKKVIKKKKKAGRKPKVDIRQIYR